MSTYFGHGPFAISVKMKAAWDLKLFVVESLHSLGFPSLPCNGRETTSGSMVQLNQPVEHISSMSFLTLTQRVFNALLTYLLPHFLIA